jgi:drug/metabolite transporter (DMT)-like permease
LKETAPNRYGYLPDLSLFASTIIWGLSFTVMKSILGKEISLLLFLFTRFVLASLIIYPFCRPKLRTLGKSGLIAGLILGILEAIGFATQSAGILFTTASKSAFITGLSAVTIPFYHFFHKKKLPEPIVIVALVFAALGLFLLTGPAGGGFNIGDFLTLICALTFGAQIYYMGQVTSKYDTLALTFVELTTTAVLAGLILPLEHIEFHPSPMGLLAIAFMIIFATAVGLGVQTWAQKRTSAVRAGLMYTAEPVFAFIFAALLLGERFNLLQKVGGLTIIVAVLGSEVIPALWKSRKRDMRPAP